MQIKSYLCNGLTHVLLNVGLKNVSRMIKNYKFSPKPATRLKNTEFIATGCSTLADAVGMQLI